MNGGKTCRPDRPKVKGKKLPCPEGQRKGGKFKRWIRKIFKPKMLVKKSKRYM